MSAWTEFKDYYDLLLPDLPGCGTAMLDSNLREVARDFCSKTDAWTVDFDPIDLVATQASYDLAAPTAQAEVVRIITLTVGSDLLWDDSDRLEGRADNARGTPKYERNDAPFKLSGGMDEITLLPDVVPTADLVGGMVIKASIMPKIDTTLLPSFLRTQNSESIRAGVFSRLMRMQKKPWSNPPLASEYAAEWRQALNFAAYKAQVGNTREHLRTRKY